jgi:hypothetical protein
MPVEIQSPTKQLPVTGAKELTYLFELTIKLAFIGFPVLNFSKLLQGHVLAVLYLLTLL